MADTPLCPCCGGAPNPCYTAACAGGTTPQPTAVLTGQLQTLGSSPGCCGPVDVTFNLVLGTPQTGNGSCVCDPGCPPTWFARVDLTGTGPQLCSFGILVACYGSEFRASLGVFVAGGCPTETWPCVPPNYALSGGYPSDCGDFVLVFDFFAFFSGTGCQCGPVRLIVGTP